jgi:hypothetical protein
MSVTEEQIESIADGDAEHDLYETNVETKLRLNDLPWKPVII